MSDKASFVEEALKLSGKSEDEAERTGKIDTADDQVEFLFSSKHRTANSPIHKLVWDKDFPYHSFGPVNDSVSDSAIKVMEDSLKVVESYKDKGNLLNKEGKIDEKVLKDLGKVGYWGLLIPKKYGGSEIQFSAFAKFLTKMATIDPTIAGLASVHGCIGAVDPLIAFGTEQQKEEFLPLLASGEKLSAFALTEPNAGSDLTALRTTATKDGDNYILNGEKLFITNATYGRLVSVVALIEGKPAVFLVDLPSKDNKTFKIKKYGLYALKHTYNRGLVFNNFVVPAKNLLFPINGDGLTIAYHGLNRGRISLCANAAGTMRMMLANMLPWASFRKTYGQSIDKRELVLRRIGEMAGLITACDALSEWGGWLLDQGYRGEMECIVAKIFGSEAQNHAAINLFMKTHGGRSFLEGHIFGDNIHEFLAPCIYEGEGEMLGMAFFKSLVKKHGSKFFEPIGKALAKNNIKKFNPLNPMHIWKLRKEIFPYIKWQFYKRFSFGKSINSESLNLSGLTEYHAKWAFSFLQKSKWEIDSLMRKHELKLPDRQCSISELSERVQLAVVMLVTAIWVEHEKNSIKTLSAHLICSIIKNKLTGKRPTNDFLKWSVAVGKLIVDSGNNSPIVSGIKTNDILMSYEEK